MKPLVLLLLFAGAMVANPVLIGPISLTGSGRLFNPDCSSHGAECLGGLGLIFSASGSNGTDTVSIDVNSVAMTNGDPHYTQNLNLTNLVFDASVGQCGTWVTTFKQLWCGVSINGITGFGAFSNIGEGVGLLQVFDQPYGGPLTLLAQAEIVNTAIVIANVTYSSGFANCPTCPSSTSPFPGRGDFVAAFDIVDPPASTPEPGNFMLTSGGLLLLYCLRARSKKQPSAEPG